MANKTFCTFASNSENVYTDAQFEALSEREDGFQPNTPANSKLANTALLESTKFIEALVDTLLNAGSQQVSGDVGPNTSYPDVVSYWTLGLSFFVNNNLNFSISKTTVNEVDSYTFNVGSNTQTITNINALFAKTADEASVAENVSQFIAGKAISAIFETNSATVKNATTATNATNTDFTNQSFSYLDIDSQSKTISLVNGATYQVFVIYRSVTTQSGVTHTEIYNFGTFVHDNSLNNVVGLRFRETPNSNLIGLSISSSNVVKLFEIDGSFNKTRLTSSSTSSVETSYILYYRRIK